MRAEDDTELKRELGEDYYTGYSWCNEPYHSGELSGYRNDEELESEVCARLEKPGFKVAVRVSNAVAILTGMVRDYARRESRISSLENPGRSRNL